MSNSLVITEQKIKENFIDYIIQTIRLSIIDMQENCKKINEHCDPWDEGEDGVAWLSNEVGLFDDLIRCIKPDQKNIEHDFMKLKTVEDCKKLLTNQTLQYISLLKNFIEKGGSTNLIFFELREKKDASRILDKLLN
jgi:hypothetical protein